MGRLPGVLCLGCCVEEPSLIRFIGFAAEGFGAFGGAVAAVCGDIGGVSAKSGSMKLSVGFSKAIAPGVHTAISAGSKARLEGTSGPSTKENTTRTISRVVYHRRSAYPLLAQMAQG